MTSPPIGKAAATSKPVDEKKPDTALEWWRALTNPQTGDRASIARLRRSATTVDAATVRAAVTLAVRLGGKGGDQRAREGLNLARVLAHVTTHSASRTVLGPQLEDGKPGSPRISEARFLRLLRAGGGEEKVTAFIRLVRMLGGAVPVDRLAYAFRYWDHPEWGDNIRERWAFDYYGAASSAPDLPTTDQEETSE